DVLPIAAGNGVVPGEELAPNDGYVPARVSGPASKMNTIPATGDFHIPNLHVIGELEEHRIIGRVDEGDLAQCKAFAIHEGDRVRSAHFLFTGGVENFIPLNPPL